MGLWLAIVIISVVSIGTWFVIEIIKISMRHSENIERIKRGYPTLDGARPADYVEPEPVTEEPIRLQ